MFRPYQEQALEQITEALRQGHSPLLHMDTGSGKTVVFSEILKRIHHKSLHSVMVVRGRKLVDQASQRLRREGVPHGVFMAGHSGMRVREPIQIASIDTIRSRKAQPKANLIVVDEAHLAISKSYREFFKLYPGVPILSVTATPYSEQGLGHIADKVIRTATFDDLVIDGWLIRPRYFCPSLPDLTGVGTISGEYNQGELGKKLDQSVLIGDLVTQYLKHAQGRKAICYAVNIHHSKAISETFNSAGIKAVHCDADTPDDLRAEAIRAFEDGITSILTNVGLWSIGVDIPCCDCIILARPTKSLILYRQQIGRGTRPFPGKSDLLVLDHSGNVLRHGFVNEEIEAVLKPQAIVRQVTNNPTTCLKCYAVFYGTTCPNCGNVNTQTLRRLEVKDGELCEIKTLTQDEELIQYVQSLKKVRKQKGYRRGWLWYELKRTRGEDVANRFFKRAPDWVKSKMLSESVSKGILQLIAKT